MQIGLGIHLQHRASPSPNRAPGAWRGKVWMAPDFEDLPPELAAAFDGAVE
jgi:hypothetical protein